ncbi:glycosyltransferase family 4 protein [Maridesulfovibrio hydrothermalis]|uniref:Glycosyl transferase group 1 n=1 Tax=Maridesulfovibrio hydrothermalis AM13 = DSM 14728 TaxID=1121451 RepID=L0RD67_9BACT|nr:glycosyltransferase family 4 protein [Maridesulfovibrio hydrothermalis]CCO24699.1 Glycosyl transferase group 1 [Maridesulfovibrio hydrothermalis AM13 = DSM 14728]
MQIAFFAPHKPIDHKNLSGDRIIGKSLHDFLCSKGHKVKIVSCMRLRHIMNSPLKWPSLYFEYRKILKRVEDFKPDLWLTYHSYYKSPDLFGPRVAAKFNIPYTIYQGAFATKHRRNYKTWLGYMANKNALIHADYIFANKEIDFHNLSRLITQEKLSRTYPGIKIEEFQFCKKDRTEIRNKLDLQGCTVVISTAMLREDVKAESMTDLIKAFALAVKKAPGARLLIAGDGKARSRLESFARKKAGNKITFLGKIPHEQLHKYFSAADLFAFPGINEALGMVYLEAQSTGLPIVAYSTRGPVEAVVHKKTGLLSPEGDIACLSNNLLELIRNKNLREKLGKAAPTHIKQFFDLQSNLLQVEAQLVNIIRRRQ